jgi:RNA polymerase sigma-70 factor (ECF subfamily)
MTTTDRYREWDAAYVLGSLPPGERREYEQHLSSCDECASAVSTLAGLAGPLSALSSEQAFALLDEAAKPPRPPDLLPELLAHAERRQRRSKRQARWRTVGIAVAAAAAAAVVALAVPWGDQSGGPAPSPPSMTAMKKVAPSPISAEARLVAGPWGTKIEGVCRYSGKSRPDGPSFEYLMYVTDRRGKTHQVGSWRAGPGTTYTFTGSTSVPRTDIAQVEIYGIYGEKKIKVLTLP